MASVDEKATNDRKRVDLSEAYEVGVRRREIVGHVEHVSGQFGEVCVAVRHARVLHYHNETCSLALVVRVCVAALIDG